MKRNRMTDKEYEDVAPRAGAWIETRGTPHVSVKQGRPSRGGVD